MTWDKVIIDVPDEILKEAVVGEFSGEGLEGVWDRSLPDRQSQLVLYFPADATPPLASARIGRIFERNGFRIPKIEMGREEKIDWTEEWRKRFTAFPLGRGFRVVPSWETVDPRETRFVLRIDPGMAFGTGTHETTRMMVEALELHPEKSSAMLDIGTGSGILAIAGRKLGFKGVVACDIDADATVVAARNASRNESEIPLFVGSADALVPSGFDLVLANLNLDAIVRFLPEIRRVLKSDGTVVFSGVLTVQEALFREALLLEGFQIETQVSCGEWLAMTVTPTGG